MTRIVITGVCGRVGRAILSLAVKDDEFQVVGAVESPSHPMVGKGLEALVGGGAAGPAIESDLTKVIYGCDVVIDFTEAGASIGHFRAAIAAGKAMVIGTTGFADSALSEIKDTEGARIVISPNMSVGVNVMFDTVERISKTLRDDYDIEVVEMHHRLKKDAPSGTAMRIKDIAEASQPDRRWIEVFGRKGITGERKNEEIGVMSLRGGDVVGEHTVIFAGIGERLEVTHRAYSRENFARGALLAARWIVHQSPGIYSMKDVLGL
jgi:4-hydroxy-tetrahydrodipicolinate reductase